jgi:hypothetical protein
MTLLPSKEEPFIDTATTTAGMQYRVSGYECTNPPTVPQPGGTGGSTIAPWYGSGPVLAQ